ARFAPAAPKPRTPLPRETEPVEKCAFPTSREMRLRRYSQATTCQRKSRFALVPHPGQWPGFPSRWSTIAAVPPIRTISPPFVGATPASPCEVRVQRGSTHARNRKDHPGDRIDLRRRVPRRGSAFHL